MRTLMIASLLALSLPLLAKTYFFDLTERAATEAEILKERGATTVAFHLGSMEATPVARDLSVVPFKELKFKSLSLTTKAGEPALPFQTLIVKGKPSQIEVQEELGPEYLLDDVIPLPAQRTKMRCADCSAKDFVVKWSEYQKDGKHFKVEYLGDFRGTHLSQVTLFPAVYSGREEALKVYPEARFQISGISSNSRAYFDTYTEPSNLLLEASLNKNFMIISPRSFVDTLKTFVDWKKSLGYNVTVYTLEDAGSTYDKVKTFIAAKYKEKAFTYAMLVGTESVFPTGYAVTTGSQRTPSDLLYWTMGGSTDYIPDVLAGRFVVSTTTDLANQIAKILEYEKGSFRDSKGLKKHIGIASNEGSNPSDVDYIQIMAKPIVDSYAVTSKLFLQANSDASASNIVKELSLGAHWVSYIGHGSGTSWPSINSGNFDGAIIKTISPDVVKPVVIDVACANGNFNTNKFGERWMNSVNASKPTGAVAYYGGSVNISWNPPAIMGVGISKIMTKKSLKHLGEVVFAGQMFMIANNANATENRDNLEWYHLFGDPTLKLRFDGSGPTVTPTPTEPVTPANLLNMNVEIGSYYVLVWNDKGDAIEGAKVTVTKGYSKSVQYINEDGWIYLPSWAYGTFKVMIEKNGYKKFVK